MPFDVDVVLRITVNTQEEADKLMEASFSGLASDLLRIGVLHGVVPFTGGSNSATASGPSNTARQAEKQIEASMELKRKEFAIEANAPEQGSQPKHTPPKKRPTGLAGRKRVGRV